MPSSIDAAILRALSLDPATATIKAHGGSGFASTFRITTPRNSFFVKTSNSSGAAVMFEGEHASLNAIHNVVPSLCPASFAWGRLEKGGYFLVTEFLDLDGSFSRNQKATTSKGSGMTLAQKLAKLHSTPAPVPDGYDKPQFGFPVSTCCGDTPQDNSFTSSWTEFFGKHRLMAILERSERNNGSDPELRATVERTVAKVVPRLLNTQDEVVPVVVHGDLWSGNKGKARFIGRDGASPDEPGPSEDVVFDPSACYASPEYEAGIMTMFGGFSGDFWKAYFSHTPKIKPENEWEDRVALYRNYHQLNHHAIFGGGGYRSSAMSSMKSLLRKYGDG